jgi:DNA mismatch endonuclease (patch repair protein)
MRAVRRYDTDPELRLRSALFAKGLRYRLHTRGLPGTPDIAFVGPKIAVFVHGCFWHQHAGCPRATIPKTNVSYWTHKLNENRMRDHATRSRLTDMGWRVIEAWQCEIDTNVERLARQIGKVVSVKPRKSQNR